MQQKLECHDDLFFPVREVPVFAGIRRGSNLEMERIPGQRAIVNCATDQVISVVSENYQLVTNREALEYAHLCCRAAFPEGTNREWRVLEAHAPLKLGSCCIDLVHPGSALEFAGPVFRGQPDTFGPFVRVTNSYNRSRALRFEIGFFRKVCSNGMILPQSSVRFAFNHNTRNISERVSFEVEKDSVAQLRERFQKFLAPLQDCKVPTPMFLPATLGVLGIRKPDPMAKRQREPWERLAAKLRSIASEYCEELGHNGYALLNVITDVASRPPKSSFVRREQQSLQRSAGHWLAEFSAECRKPGFDVISYLDKVRRTPQDPPDTTRFPESYGADTPPRVD